MFARRPTIRLSLHGARDALATLVRPSKPQGNVNHLARTIHTHPSCSSVSAHTRVHPRALATHSPSTQPPCAKLVLRPAPPSPHIVHRTMHPAPLSTTSRPHASLMSACATKRGADHQNLFSPSNPMSTSSTVAKTGKKIVVVGGVAGGASFAARARRLDEDCQITIFEAGPYASFANCGLPYYVGNTIDAREKLLVATEARMKNYFDIDVKTNHKVTHIDRENKQVTVEHDGDTQLVDYDELVLATGGTPLRPPIEGIQQDGIFTVSDIPDADAIKDWIAQRGAQKAVVVGGGFIGIEMCEQMVHLGMDVTVVEMLDQVLPPLDKDMAGFVHAELRAHGVTLSLNDGVASFGTTDAGAIVVHTASGAAHECEICILAIGVRANSGLAKDAGLELGQRGGVLVKDTLQTVSDEHVWAVGDVVEKTNYQNGEPMMFAMAGPANRQGRMAANNMFGKPQSFRGVQGTAVVQVFDLTVAQTGFSEKAAKRSDLPYAKVYNHTKHHVAYYPGAQTVHCKLLFNPDDGKLMGLQAIGKDGAARRVDVVSALIQKGGDVYDLEEAELCYSPQHGAAKDVLNILGMTAVNVLDGVMPVMHWEDLQAALDADEPPVLLDVRNQDEWDAGHVKAATLFPLPNVRDHTDDELKAKFAGKHVVVYCAAGKRAYYVQRHLMDLGINCTNLSGGMTTLESMDFAGLEMDM